MDKEVLMKYAYIYNVIPQSIPFEAHISFSNNDITIESITHIPGTNTILLGSKGYYAIWFDVQSAQPIKFLLLQNGTPIASIPRKLKTGTNFNPSLVIITAACDDILTLQNQTIGNAVELRYQVDETQFFPNSCILIRKIS